MVVSDAVIVAVVAAVPGVLSTVVSFLNQRKLTVVKEAINGRLTELLELTRAHAYMEADGTTDMETPEAKHRRMWLEKRYARKYVAAGKPTL